MSAYSDLISGARGTYVVNNDSEFTKNSIAYYVAEDTVINTLKVGGVDMKSHYIAAVGTALKAGTLIVPRSGLNHTMFSAIDLVSGSVVALLA